VSTGGSETVCVLLADDSPAFLAAAVAVVEATPGFEVAGVCGSIGEAVEIARTVRPDVALVDESLPGPAGRAATAAIHEVSPDTLVILLSADPGQARAAAPVDKAELSPAKLEALCASRLRATC
jgi:DNA-binding NarL/FixJ family response regulator